MAQTQKPIDEQIEQLRNTLNSEQREVFDLALRIIDERKELYEKLAKT